MSTPAIAKRITSLKILLVIDSVFFFVELISGYAVGSLALVADSFHMLNDVVSLFIALKAIELSESAATHRYSYGFPRAEILGALVNGVFLLALCFSIGMEAIARFFSQVEITNPQLVVAVGTAGLLSNIVGLFLFHDHGHGGHSHSHGGHSHHEHNHDLEAAKPKVLKPTKRHSISSVSASDRTPLLATTPSFIPANALPPISASTSTLVQSSSASSIAETEDEEEESELERRRRLEEELFVHPGEFRAGVIRAAHDAGYGSNAVASTSTAHAHDRRTSVGSKHDHSSHDHHSSAHAHAHGEGEAHDHGHSHGDEEAHVGGGGGGHSHEGSMNMRGVFLHVLGDALGNVGVIGAGLVIWLTDYSWRFYADPMISLAITVIIFSSALPLVKSASFILLQGVPSSVPLELVRSGIAAVPGVLNVHELHVWSLSESKTVASVHVLVRNKEDFVEVSRSIRKVMHRFGIHSSTIQPEIAGQPATSLPNQFMNQTISATESDENGCLIKCVDNSCAAQQCCPTPTAPGSPQA